MERAHAEWGMGARGAEAAGIGLAQGIGLCLLASAAATPTTWPATVPWMFEPLALILTFLPPLAMLSRPRLSRRAAAIWLAAVMAVVVAIAVHDATRGTPRHIDGEAAFWPPAEVWFSLGATVFVAYAVAIVGIRERTLRPSHGEMFAEASRTFLQLALAGVFVGVFWLVLYAGDQLFKLVRIEFLGELLQRNWFAYPATSLAFAAALTLADARPAVINGIRSVVVALFSWLLPVVALIVLVFLAGLPFVSLEALWKSRMSAGLLLGMSAALAFFLNCATQSGADGQPPAGVRRIAAICAALEILPLVALAAWGLSLRVGQYGWSADRVTAAATMAVAGVAGIGYALAAIPRGAWLKRVEPTNLAVAYVFVLVMVGLHTPLADPARLMVADQLARLRSGAVAPDEFDFAALKFDGARWGNAALAALAEDPGATEAVRSKAKDALQKTSRYTPAREISTSEEFRRSVTVFPKGREVPEGLFEAIAGARDRMNVGCSTTSGQRCTVIFLTTRPGVPESVIFYDRIRARLFEPLAGSGWRLAGEVQGATHCPAVREALGRGEFRLEPHGYPDLRVGSRLLSIDPVSPRGCD
jgi:hypothetical protein